MFGNLGDWKLVHSEVIAAIQEQINGTDATLGDTFDVTMRVVKKIS